MGMQAIDAGALSAAVEHLTTLRLGAIKVIAREMGKIPPSSAGHAGEAGRLAAIKAAARPPETCGPAIPLAPARGRVVDYTTWAMGATPHGFEPQHSGFRGRSSARAADVFDVMIQQVQRRGGRDPLTSAQVATARLYAAMVERHAARGVRCISVEAQGGGGSGGGDGGYIDAVLDEGAAIRRMEAAAGESWALEVKYNRGGTRRSITARRLVDMVCLEGRTVSEALKVNGWSVYGDTVTRAYGQLGAALDRMAKA